MEVLIAIPAAPETTDARRAHTELPKLPGLTRLLRRGRRLPGSTDWRRGVLSAIGPGGQQATAAAVAACAVPALSAGAPLCFAAPLHVVAGLSRVHLPPGGPLLLDIAEEQAWRGAFNAEFGAEGVRLHAAAAGGAWLLEAPFAHAARDAAPEQVLGAALERTAAADAAQRALRRLGAEVEMWLAAHGLNREREARHDPVLNAIWFWDGAHVAALPRPARPYRLVGGAAPDAWLAGLAAHLQVPLVPADGWVAALRATGVPDARECILIVPARDTASAPADAWQQLEDQWFAPLAAALDAGEVDAVQLQMGGQAWQSGRRSRRHWLPWRRQAWWQLGARPS